MIQKWAWTLISTSYVFDALRVAARRGLLFGSVFRLLNLSVVVSAVTLVATKTVHWCVAFVYPFTHSHSHTHHSLTHSPLTHLHTAPHWSLPCSLPTALPLLPWN